MPWLKPLIVYSRLPPLLLVHASATSIQLASALSGARHILSSAPDKADANWTEVADAWTSNNGGNLEYTISGLSQGTSYDVQVRAENDEGTSGWSSYSCRDVTFSQCSTRDCIYLTDHCGREQHSSIVTVTATDADSDDNITGYGIVDAADGSQFEITSGGVLTFKTAPNYEDPEGCVGYQTLQVQRITMNTSWW